MSTPLQPIWLIDPVDPPTDPVLVVREIPDPLTDVIPVQRPRPGSNTPLRLAVPRTASSRLQPRYGSRNLVAVVLMLMLLLGGAATVISAFL
jgi:hypothetical protein